MATTKSGANGAFSGKVGSVIGSNWRDIHYIKGIPRKFRKAPTAKQLGARNRFMMLSSFLLAVKEAVDLGFRNEYKGRLTALNRAVSANKEMFTSIDGRAQLDLPAMILSTGNSVTKPADFKVSRLRKGFIRLSWNIFSETPVSGERITDRAIIILYSRERDAAKVIAGHHSRQDQAAEIRIPLSWQSHCVHVYIFMSSVTGKNSQTLYAAALNST